MKRRVLSLLLALMMTVSLFAGLTTNASAATVLSDVFNQLINRNRDSVGDLFNANNLVLEGSCAKDGSRAVQYEIYRVDPSTLTSSSLVKNLRTALGDLAEDYDLSIEEKLSLTDISYQFDSNEEYYGVKIFGNGEMADYSLGHNAPWTGKQELGNTTIDFDKQLVAAYVEDGVTSVGERAFFGQDQLTAVFLGDSVKTIGAKAFESCDKLSVVSFPRNLERIERRAFYACDYMTFARMAACINLKTIGERAFACCNRLTAVSFPTGTTEIGRFAFAFDHVLGAEQFTLPAGLKTIGNGAFFWCTHLGMVNEVNIPSQVTRIGDWAFFANFDMRELKFSDGGAQTMTIGTGAFVGSCSLQIIHFADRVRDIGDYAFAACDKLTEVVFGTGNGSSTMHINTIGDRAFTSLEATGLEALTAVAKGADEENDGDVVSYLNHSLTAGYAVTDFTNQTSGVTPLAEAVFTFDPPAHGNVQPATSALNTFPDDCIIIYPTQQTAPQVYARWHSVVTAGGLWEEYQTEESWVGHFHAYGDPIVVEATCTEPGYETYICSICQAEKVVETDPATGHKATMIRSLAPTCTEDGVAFYHCSNKWCTQPDYTEVLPATEHGKGDGTYPNLLNREETAADCTHSGRITGVCPDCGERIEVTTPALGHSTTYMSEVQAADCTHDGLYRGVCDRCNQTTSVTVPALGHSWNEGHITRRPTTEADGERTYICTVCGEKKTEVIRRIGYVETFVDTVVAPTCTEEGYTIHNGSDGTVYKDNYLPALGHAWNEGVVTQKPTATQPGTREQTCDRCGEKRTVVIEPLGGISFVDVPENAYYYQAVVWAVQNGITAGTGDGTTFSPNMPCDRAQAVTFLYRAAGSPEVSGSAGFTDVSEKAYYYKAVVWAVKNGITAGTGDGTTFSPGMTCDRAQIVSFLYRYAGKPASSGSVSFSDVNPRNYYYEAVRWAVKNGITAGTGDGTTFSPNMPCDRAQMVSFLYRAQK